MLPRMEFFCARGMVAGNKHSLATNHFFYYCGVITHRRMLVFVTPVKSFYICNQDPLLTDICLLEGTLLRCHAKQCGFVSTEAMFL